MFDRPLVLFPVSIKTERKKRKGFGKTVHTPSAEKQYDRLHPMFDVLTEAFEKKRILLQNSLMGIEPEYALVFEVVSNVDNFINAVKKAEGMEWLFDFDLSDIEPDDDFYNEANNNKTISRKVYCVMTNRSALNQLLSLWKRFSQGEKNVFPRGLSGLKDIFCYLRNIRTWNENDRIEDTQVFEYWSSFEEQDVPYSVPFEIELFFRNNERRRRISEELVSNEIYSLGGKILQSSCIPEIAYHALLVELPISKIRSIVENFSQVKLVKIDDIMFFRPVCQSSFNGTLDESVIVDDREGYSFVNDKSPVIAVFDGMPIQNHSLLKGRLVVDDPDGFEQEYESKYRSHGTAMSSLILNGDLNQKELLKHSIYVRPIFKPRALYQSKFTEEIPNDFLVVDLIYRAVLRLYGVPNVSSPVANSVRIINLSLGDPSRQLTSFMSPLAKIIDYLSFKYSVLFIVSAGNHAESSSFLDCSFDEFKKMNLEERTSKFLNCIKDNQCKVRLLSPAENINGLTIGALYDDNCNIIENERVAMAVKKGFPSPISSFGKGFNSIITPDLFYMGGRKLLKEHWGGICKEKCDWNASYREPGCRVAAPANGSQNGQAYTFGTSDATALVSHEALKCYDVLNEIFISETGAPPDSKFVSILIKAMLTHGASWGDLSEQLQKILKINKKSVSSWLGYGIPNFNRVKECSRNRVTLIGTGIIKNNEGHLYKLPLPIDISSKVIKRRLIVTLSYFSPISPNKQSYRVAKLWFNVEGNESLSSQRTNPDWQAVQRGTLQHEIFESDEAIVWNDDNYISIIVSCKIDDKKSDKEIPYCIFVTFEVADGQNIEVYSKVVNKIKATVIA